MLQTGDWVSTRFLGQIDYYNAKPPLNVWLIALAFKTFGVSPASLRLTSVACAWLTVAILMLWVRQIYGDLPGLLAGMVLATCFAFVYVHSARTANTDALFTLLMLLVAMTMERAGERPWLRVWLGPIFAMVFLLRGSAVLMPLVLVVVMAWRDRWTAGRSVAANCHRHPGVRGAHVGLGHCAVACGRVGILRQAVELRPRLAQFRRARGTRRKRPLLPGRAAEVPVPTGWWQRSLRRCSVRRARCDLRGWLLFWRSGDRRTALIGFWAAISLAIPTAMMTKVSWYFDPFYPVFALMVALLIARV